MKIRSYILISLLCLAFGMLLYGFYQEWIIIRLPWYSANAITHSTPTTTKPMVSLWWWKTNQWKHETQQILWSTTTTDNVFHVLQAWIALMKEEQKINPMTTLQSAAITNADHVYISFDHNPLLQTSVYEKWMLIESLLKTIRENKLSVQSIVFLVNHKILQDHHLDFSCPWPVQGFLS